MRRTEIDQLKGLAILGVIISHLNFRNGLSNNSIELLNALQLTFGWCVLAFFFSSGMVQTNKVDTYKKFYEFIAKRFRRLIIPCFVFSLSYNIVEIALSLAGIMTWGNAMPKTGLDFFYFFFQPVGPQLYFLPFLFFIAILGALVQAFLSLPVLKVLTFTLLPFIYSFIETPLDSHGDDSSIIPVYIFMYLLGMLFVEQEKEPEGFKAFSLLLFLTVSLTCLITSSFVFCQILVPYILIYILIYILKQYKKPFSVMKALKLDKNSGAIYVWHTPIILPFVSILIPKLFGGSVFSVFVILLLIIILCNGVALIVDKYRVFKLWRF